MGHSICRYIRAVGSPRRQVRVWEDYETLQTACVHVQLKTTPKIQWSWAKIAERILSQG